MGQVMLRTRLRMRRRGTLRHRVLRLVPSSASPRCGRGRPTPSPPARPRANVAVRLFCPPHTHPHTPKIDNGGKSIQGRCVSTTMPLGAVLVFSLKIYIMGQVMLRTRLCMRRHDTPRRRLLQLVPGMTSPGWGRWGPNTLPPGSASG